MNNYHIIKTHWSAHKNALSDIRTRVFMQEQQVSAEDEWDDKDETAIHFLVTTLEHQALGCARLLIEDNVLHIGRVAVITSHRNQGIGTRLMKYILKECAQQFPHYSIYLHAQTTRIAFYQRLGFTNKGDIFMDAGIPHQEMWFNNNLGQITSNSESNKR